MNTPVEIDFEQRTYWYVRERESRVRGKIILGTNNRFNVSTSRLNFVSDGETLWEYNSRQRQVRIQRNAPQIFDFLRADLSDENVEITMNGDLVSRIVIVDKDNNVTTYTFNSTRFLDKVDDSLFHFVIPQGAQVHED
jgi:outer membrane lipoprotein-sorting protein